MLFPGWSIGVSIQDMVPGCFLHFHVLDRADAQMNDWAIVAAQFHDRVRASCWDTLAGELLSLHQPWLTEGSPKCRGCDRDDRGVRDAVWPCRTYTVLASTLLGIPNVEATLSAMLAVDEQRLTHA